MQDGEAGLPTRITPVALAALESLFYWNTTEGTFESAEEGWVYSGQWLQNRMTLEFEISAEHLISVASS